VLNKGFEFRPRTSGGKGALAKCALTRSPDGFLIVGANLANLSFAFILSDPHTQTRQVHLETPSTSSAWLLLPVDTFQALANVSHYRYTLKWLHS
jgi:hypothetical protein